MTSSDGYKIAPIVPELALMPFTTRHNQHQMSIQYQQPRHYTCYQFSKDGQSYRPIYYSQEAIDAYVQEQQIQSDRRQEITALQRQQESLRMQHEPSQIYGSDQDYIYRGSSYFFEADRSPAQYRYPASEEQYLMPRHHTSPLMPRYEYQPDFERPAPLNVSQDLQYTQQQQHQVQQSPMDDYPKAYHQGDDSIQDQHQHQHFPAATEILSPYSLSRSQSLQCTTKLCSPMHRREFFSGPSEPHHEWHAPDTHLHGHVNPNALSLTPMLTAAVPSAVDMVSADDESAHLASSHSNTTSNNVEGRIGIASPIQLTTDSPESFVSRDLTEDDEHQENISEEEEVDQCSARPSSSVDAGYEIESIVEHNEPRSRVQDHEMTDTDAEDRRDDSDSDYRPELQLRPRRQVSSCRRYSSTQPKRGVNIFFTVLYCTSSANRDRSSTYQTEGSSDAQFSGVRRYKVQARSTRRKRSLLGTVLPRDPGCFRCFTCCRRKAP